MSLAANLFTRFPVALELAFRVHQGQTWPGSEIPYIAHTLETACRTAAMGAPPDTVLAALLHDAKRDQTPEQKEALLREIRQSLGDNVAEILIQAWEGHLLPHGDWEE